MLALFLFLLKIGAFKLLARTPTRTVEKMNKMMKPGYQ